MTREEKISQATYEYIEKVLANRYSVDFEDIEFAFQSGVEWADEHPINVWHDAGEEPGKPCLIIIEIDVDIDPTYEVISTDGIDEELWKYLSSEMDITRWAYINDLLPKGGEA